MNRFIIFVYLLTVTASLQAADDIKPTIGMNEQMLKAIVSIERIDAAGRCKPIGTGFLYLTPTNLVSLVTARHVVTGGGTNPLDNLGYRINIKNSAATVLKDSCIQPIAGPWFLSDKHDVAVRFFPYGNTTDILAVPSTMNMTVDRVKPAATILILGFPMGLRSEEHTTAIVRRGSVARSDPNVIVVDAAVFPGNSGGPVFYFPELKLGSSQNVQISTAFYTQDALIGIVSESISYVEPAISPQTGRSRVTFEENSGLCNVIPVDALIELLNREDVRAFADTLKNRR